MVLLKKIANNLFYISLSELISKLLVFLYTLHLSRVLGAEGLGKLGFAASVLSFLILFVSIGIDSYGIRTVAQNPTKQKEIVDEIFTLRLILSILIYSLFLFLIYNLDLSQESKTITIIYCVSLFGHALNMNWVFLAIEKMKPIAIRQIAVSIVTSICVFLLIDDKDDTIIASAIIGFSTLISLLIVIIYYVFKVDKINLIFKISRAKIIIYSSITIGISFLITTIYNNVSTYLLGVMIDDDFYQTGIISAAQKFLALGTLSSIILQQAFFTTFSKMNNNLEEGKSLFLKFLNIMIILGLITSIIIFIYADKIILIQFGDKFIDSIPVLRILSFNVLLVFLNVLYTTPIVAWHQEKIFMKSVSIACIFNIILNIILIPHFKAIGVSYIIVFTELITNIALVYFFRKLYNFSGTKLILKQILLINLYFIPGYITYFYYDLVYLSILINLLTIIFIFYSNNLLTKTFILSLIKKQF